jgi:hypothetical protein
VNWFGKLLIGMLILEAVLNVLSVGCEREPVKPWWAAVTVVLNALVIWGLIHYWGR